MTLRVAEPCASGLGAVATGLDLAEDVAPAASAALRRAYAASPVLCIRGGPATPEAFLRLARVFGTPQIQLLGAFRDEAFPEISYIERGQRDTLGDGKRITFGSHWHTDDSYMAVPCASTLLYGDVVPPAGGDTSFANMHMAYEALSDSLKVRIAGLRAVHTYQSRRNVSPVPRRTAEEEARTPPVSHPLVRTHPQTGRKALYLNPNRIDRIEGLPLAEGDALLDDLIACTTRPEFVYVHAWRADDVVIWDNCCTMHKASPHDGAHPRRMTRILLEGTAPA